MNEDNWLRLGSTSGWGQFLHVHLIREYMFASTIQDVLPSNIQV